MHRLRRDLLMQGLKAGDTAAVALCLVLGQWVSSSEIRHPDPAGFFSVRLSIGNMLLGLIFLALTRLVLDCCGLYRSQRSGACLPLYHASARAVSGLTLLL